MTTTQIFSQAPQQETGNGVTQSLFREGEEVSERQEVVVFHEEGEVCKAEDANSSAFRDYMMNADDGLANDVKGFLSRPIQVRSFVWDNTKVALTEVAAVLDLPYEWYHLPMPREKLAGFTFLRCDLVVRVQVNAQPFNAGRLIVWFNPFEQQQREIYSARRHLGGITGYRHVDLDLSESTAVELRIPYLCPLSHINVVNGFGNLGAVHFTVYSPLTGSSDIDGVVWVHAENIDVQMPSGLAVRTGQIQSYPDDVIDLDNEVLGVNNVMMELNDALIDGKIPDKGQVEQTIRTGKTTANAIGNCVINVGGSPVAGDTSNVVNILHLCLRLLLQFHQLLLQKKREPSETTVRQASSSVVRFQEGILNIIRSMPSGEIQGNDTAPKGRRTDPGVAKEKKKGGTVETISKTVSGVASALTGVPVIGNVASAVSWIADAVGGVASLFGWSRPTDPAFSTLVNPTFARHMANFNGDAKSKPLGLDARNAVEIPHDLFQTDEDELSLKYTLSRPIFYDKFKWSTGDVQGKVLWRSMIDPTMSTKKLVGTATQVNETLMSYVSRLFAYWRGSINLHFKIVKTVFHSGRIRVVWAPGIQSYSDLANNQIEKCYSQTFDIKDRTSFDFNIPFVWNEPWKNLTHENSRAPTLPLSEVYGDAIGSVYIVVLNALRVPDTAADTIEFLVETSGGEDLQFAYPSFTGVMQPDNTVHITSGQIQGNDPEPFFENKQMTGFNPNLMGIGEVVVSLRQLLKRYHFFGSIPAETGDGYALISPNFCSYMFPGRQGQNNAYDWISRLYMFRSGSMRLMVTPQSQVTLKSKPVILIEPIVTELVEEAIHVAPFVIGHGHVTAEQRFYPDQEQIIELDIPFYQGVPAIPTGIGAFDGNLLGAQKPDYVPYNTGTSIRIQTSADAYDLYRAIGEDFSLGYQIGPPTTSF